jgi:putative cell wall-binding protein
VSRPSARMRTRILVRPTVVVLTTVGTALLGLPALSASAQPSAGSGVPGHAAAPANSRARTTLVSLRVPAVVPATRADRVSVLARPAGSADVQPAAAATTGGGRPHVVAVLPKTATSKFGLVGVTWRAGFSTAHLTVQVRSHVAGSWTGWNDLDIDDDGPAGTVAGVRDGTSPTWVGDADGIGVRLLSTDGSVPDDVQVAVIDGGTGLAQPAPTASRTLARTATTATATGVPQPPIVTRAQWGADTSTETPCSAPRTSSTLRGIVLHHTVNANDYTAAQAPGLVRAIHRYHTVSLGWCDTGYNFLVDRFGTIYEGRRGGITQQVRGAHAGNWDANLYTTGISMIGNFDTAPVPKATKQAVVALMAWRLASFGLSATGTMSIDGVKIPTISGHRDIYLGGIRPATATACPGKYAYAWLNGGLRSDVQAVLDSAGDTGPVLSRMSGQDRYATAAAISKASFTSPVNAVFLASGEAFPDALSAGPAAAGQGAPILLTPPDALPEATITELKRLAPSRIYVLGGEFSVSAAVATQAAQYAGSVVRLAGRDRYLTGVRIVKAFWPASDVVYLASGENYPDALSGGALAAHQSAPILLSPSDSLPASVLSELQTLHPSRVVLLGGPMSLQETIATEVSQALPAASVTRLSGPDRYATSAVIAASGWNTSATAYFAAGMNFPDALAGVPAAASDGAPLLLSRRGCLPAPVFDETTALAPTTKVLLGGQVSLSGAVTSNRCAG